MRKRTIIVCVCFAGVLCGFFPLSSTAVVPDDLALGTTTVQKLVVSPGPNPHDARKCTDCHQDLPTSRPPRLSAASGLLKDEFPDEICLRCHKEQCVLRHPPDAQAGGEGRLQPPEFLPLRLVREGIGKVTCMTCHDLHYPHTGNRLLRGYAVNPAVEESRLRTRLDLCRACHGEGISGLSPHRGEEEDGRCSLCHLEQDGSSKPGELRAGVNQLCALCHPVFPKPHYLSFNPFPEVPPGFPGRDRPDTCVTCHQPHGDTGLPFFLRAAYLEAARSSSRVNPHGRTLFCRSCHPDTVKSLDQPGPAPLNTEDRNQLCRRCHATGRITGMAHPLGPLAEGFQTPGDLPLFNNEVTCLTCHTEGHARPDRENPWFLRGGPYETPRELCGTCHDLEAYGRLKPHEEMPYDRGCDICHLHGDSYPGSRVKVGPPAADANMLCLRCHVYYDHPANWRHTLRPGTYDYAIIDLGRIPLDRFGRITCYSCHQVHRQETERFYLRAVRSAGVRTSVCAVCHPY